MPTFTLLDSVRLTGKFTNRNLDIVTKRDGTEIVEYLDIKSDFEPVRVDLYPFTDDAGARWEFTGSIWQAGPEYASASIGFTDGDGFLAYEIEAREANTGAKAPKKLYLRIKPVVDAPDQPRE